LGDADAADNTANNMHNVLDDIRVYDRAFTADELKAMVLLYQP
jgi:hypothetical protein